MTSRTAKKRPRQVPRDKAPRNRAPSGKKATRSPIGRAGPGISASAFDVLVDRVVDDATDRIVLAEAGRDTADYLPVDLVRRLVLGESPVRIWRIHRGMKQVDLAAASGVKKARLSQIEHGAAASVEKMAALARALGASIDDLI